MDPIPKEIQSYILSFSDNLRNCSRVCKLWNSLTFNHLIDIVFVIDSTGSSGFLINKAISLLERLETLKCRFGIICYRDHDKFSDSVVSSINLTFNTYLIRTYLYKIRPFGGDDYPEAIIDGLYQCLSMNWKAKKRYIILVNDAPAHGYVLDKNMTDVKYKDNYPYGCPCNLNVPETLKSLVNKDINIINMIDIHDLKTSMNAFFQSIKDTQRVTVLYDIGNVISLVTGHT